MLSRNAEQPIAEQQQAEQEQAEQPLRVLSEAQVRKYQSDGYLGVESLVSPQWLERLNTVTEEFVQISCGLDASGQDAQGNKDRRFDLENDHRADAPRIRRLNSPVDYHDVYWEFASQGPFVDVAVDLLGPDVKFHHAKLNFKWGGV